MADASTVTVRLFAALRDTAGTAEVTIEGPVPLSELLAELVGRFGPRFAARVRIAAVMVDGTPVDREDDVVIQAGAEVALLPPFAGG